MCVALRAVLLVEKGITVCGLLLGDGVQRDAGCLTDAERAAGFQPAEHVHGAGAAEVGEAHVVVPEHGGGASRGGTAVQPVDVALPGGVPEDRCRPYTEPVELLHHASVSATSPTTMVTRRGVWVTR